MSQFVAQADRAFVDEDYAAADKLYAKASLQFGPHATPHSAYLASRSDTDMQAA